MGPMGPQGPEGPQGPGLVGTATHVPFYSATGAAVTDAAFTWNNTTKTLNVGDIGGQGANASQTAPTTAFPGTYSPLRGVQYTTSNVGSGSNVLVTAHINYALAADGAVVLRIMRNNVPLTSAREVSRAGEDNTISLSWLDTPTAGFQTYILEIVRPDNMIIHSSALQVVEIKN